MRSADVSYFPRSICPKYSYFRIMCTIDLTVLDYISTAAQNKASDRKKTRWAHNSYCTMFESQKIVVLQILFSFADDWVEVEKTCI